VYGRKSIPKRQGTGELITDETVDRNGIHISIHNKCVPILFHGAITEERNGV
jgi:hypothetical protein